MRLWGGFLSSIRGEIDEGTARPCLVGDYLKARMDAGHAEAPGRGTTSDGWMRDMLLAYTAGTVHQQSRRRVKRVNCVKGQIRRKFVAFDHKCYADGYLYADLYADVCFLTRAAYCLAVA